MAIAKFAYGHEQLSLLAGDKKSNKGEIDRFMRGTNIWDLAQMAWCRSSRVGPHKRGMLWPVAAHVTFALVLLFASSCASGPSQEYSHAGDLVTEWPVGAELTLRDHLGSGVAIVDDKGADRFQRSYHPYGSTRSEFVADLGAATGQADHYVGNERDVGADLGHFHARPYDYQVGRFLGPDPLRLFPSWDDDASTAQLAAYSYTAGNPIALLDPDGLWPRSVRRLATVTVGEVAFRSVGGGAAMDHVERATGLDGNAQAKVVDDIAVQVLTPTGEDMQAGAAMAPVDGLYPFADVAGVIGSMARRTPAKLAKAFQRAIRGVSTPWGVARQEHSIAALNARAQVREGATLYRIGTTGRSNTTGAQFWALEHPSTAGFASRYGLPPKNVSNANFIQKATIKPGTNFVTRQAPPVGSNAGGGVEVVVPENGVNLGTFSSQ